MIPVFGENLRNLRLARNLSQGKLATLLGISVSVVGLYENSFRMPSYEVLVRMARLFHVSTDYLLGADKSSTTAFDLEGLSAEQVKAIFTVVNLFKEGNENARLENV